MPPQAAVNHCDESGVRVAGRLHWLRVVCNAHLTFSGVHPKRGTEAMNALDIMGRARSHLRAGDAGNLFRSGAHGVARPTGTAGSGAI